MKALRIAHVLWLGLAAIVMFAASASAAPPRATSAARDEGLQTDVTYVGTWTHTFVGSPSGMAVNPGTETVTSDLTFSESVSLYTPPEALTKTGHGANSYENPVTLKVSGSTKIEYTGSNLRGCSASFFGQSGLAGDQWLIGGFGQPVVYISVNELHAKGLVAVYGEAPGLRSSVHPEFISRRTGGDPSNTSCEPANMPIGDFPCNNLPLINNPEYTPSDRGFHQPPYGFLHAVALLDPHTNSYAHPYDVKMVLSSCDGKDTVIAHSRLIVKNSHVGAPRPEVAGPPAPDPKLVKLDARLAAHDDLLDALQHAPLPCLEVAIGAGGVVVGTATLYIPAATIGGTTTAVAAGECAPYVKRILDDYLVLKQKDPPLDRFARLVLPGCGSLSGAALSGCNQLRAAGASVVAAAQRSAKAANALNVSFAALSSAVLHKQQATITKETPVVTRATAELRAAGAAQDSAETAFYQLIGQAGATVRLTKQQSAAGIAKVLEQLKAQGITEVGLKQYAGTALTPKAALIVAPSTQPKVAAKPAIMSVQFTGSPSNPGITLRGRGLTPLPSPDPSGSPAGHNGCPSAPGNMGTDYGLSLYLADQTKGWSAGNSTATNTSCIGLIPTKVTPTVLTFRLGSFYTDRYPQYNLAHGDQVQLTDRGATLEVHVSYGTPVTT